MLEFIVIIGQEKEIYKKSWQENIVFFFVEFTVLEFIAWEWYITVMCMICQKIKRWENVFDVSFEPWVHVHPVLIEYNDVSLVVKPLQTFASVLLNDSEIHSYLK